MNYSAFLEQKKFREDISGFDISANEINSKLFDFQKAIVRWALKRGKAAIFADTGLGKSFMEAEWAWNVFQRTGNRVLILAPLCVGPEINAAALALGYGPFHQERKFTKDGRTGVYIANYEMIHEYEDAIRQGFFDGIVLDESSIIKHESSKTRNRLVEISRHIPYRLSCTATPSPNDHMELGNQAEFLGIMKMTEMLSMFFIHDSGETSKWRLKGHGRKKFWQWLSTWACVIRKPSDIGFSDEGYDLPGLEIKEIIVPSKFTVADSATLSGRNEARRLTIDERVEVAAQLVSGDPSSWVVWCNLNDESAKLTKSIGGAVEVRGSDSVGAKENNLLRFKNGDDPILVTKPSIAGFGLNWQHCHNMVFVGLNDSFEQLYQAIRRCYRFGQKNVVKVYLISSELEGATLENLKRKESQADEMAREMMTQMRDFTRQRVTELENEKADYLADKITALPRFLEV